MGDKYIGSTNNYYQYYGCTCNKGSIKLICKKCFSEGNRNCYYCGEELILKTHDKPPTFDEDGNWILY